MPSLINGLGGAAGFGEGVLQPGDDLSSGPIDITSVFGTGGLYLNGAHYTSLYVNTNGSISFGAAVISATPTPFVNNPNSPLIVAPYWMDLDTRGPDRVSVGGASTGSNAVYYDLDAAAKTFTATWDDVGYTDSGNLAPAAFQLQLISRGPADLDIVFTYEAISVPPTAGVPGAWAGWSLANAGSFQMAGSGVTSRMTGVDTLQGNTGVVGTWVWHIHMEQPPEPPVISPPEPPVLPPPPAEPPIPDPEDEDPVNAPHSVSFALEIDGLHREGDSGVTPYNVTILRLGDDLASASYVDWEIVISDPDDLAPGQALSGTAVFGPGQKSAVIVVGIQGDRVFEQDEMFEFRLTNAVHGDQVFNPNAGVLGIIVNDDSPVVFDFSGPQIRAEGLAGTAPFDFVVVRSGDVTLASTVTWELLRGATDSADFAPDQPLNGTVTFAPGARQAVIQIQVSGDTRAEPDETFTVRLTQANTGGSVTMPTASTTGTILDDDVRHALLVATPSALVIPEGNSGGTAFAYTLLRTGDLSLSVTIPYAVALPPGGITAAEVQGPLSGFVTFAAGAAEAMLTVVINGDTTPEDNETFLVTLGGGDFNNLTLSGVVMNDDQGGGAVLAAGPGARSAAPVDMGGEVTSFFQNLAGGGLWSGNGGL